MLKRIQFLFLYFGFWLIFFVAARIIFLGYHIKDTQMLLVKTVGGIFWYGVPMDISMAGYLSILPFILVAFGNFFKKSRLENMIFSYTFLMVLLFSLLIITDLEVFNIWGYRLDATPFAYLKSVSDAWISIRASPIIQLFISFILLLAVASFIVYRIITKNIDQWPHIDTFPSILLLLLFTLALYIPIRGGFNKNTIAQKSVYFSENNFANIAAINAPWNFFSSLISQTFDKVNPYTFLPKEELAANYEYLLSQEPKNEFVLNKKNAKPNVILIISNDLPEKIINRHLAQKDGIYFSNFYAGSNQIIQNIPAILSAYPALAQNAILTSPAKIPLLPIMSKDFEQQGYATSFYFGGDLLASNLKLYLYSGYFQKIISKQDFPKAKDIVNDALVFNSLQLDLNKQKEPFFSAILGQTDYLTPNELNGEAIDNFLQNAPKQSWWPNTLIIIMKGKNTSEGVNTTDDFKVPMLWIGGAIEQKGKTISRIVSQTDLAATLLQQLSFNSTAYKYSKNIFNGSIKAWAYFTYNNGFGFVQPTSKYIYDNLSRQVIYQENKPTKSDINLGKTIEQKSYQDYLNQ